MPVMRVPAKPLPISKPFEAGSESSALREVGLELVEDRLAEARRHAPRHARDHAAERVAAAARRVDRLLHARRGLGVGAAHRARLDLRERHALGVHLRVQRVDAARPTRAPRRSRPRRAASARSRRPRRGRSSRARSRARRPASCGCRTSPRWCSPRARGGRRPSSPRRPRAARPRCAPAARSGCRACGPRTRPRGSRRGPPPGAAW